MNTKTIETTVNDPAYADGDEDGFDDDISNVHEEVCLIVQYITILTNEHLSRSLTRAKQAERL